MSTSLDSTTSKPTIPKFDLSRPEDVLAYLTNTTFASTLAEPLSGGTANFIFRLHLVKSFATSGDDVKTLILKHAKSWIGNDKTFEYAIERQTLATVPALYHHDPDAHVLIMEDAGPDARNLKDLLRESAPNEQASRNLGTALGRFLAAVHVHGTADAALLAGVQNNDDSRRLTAWVTYGRLVDTLKEFGTSATLVDPPLASMENVSEKQMAEVGALADSTVRKITEARSTFTMGDFWTGNIVVRLSQTGTIERIFVVDWEMSKPGLTFIDFAQFAAEMNTLRRFHPKANASVITALSAYAEAYKQGARVDAQFVGSAAAHLGAHMITISPRIKNWNGTKERTREIVKEGIEYLLRGIDGDAQWLKSSVVGGFL